MSRTLLPNILRRILTVRFSCTTISVYVILSKTVLRRSALIPYPSKKDGQVSFADAKVRLSSELTKPQASFFYLFTTFREYTLYIIIFVITFTQVYEVKVEVKMEVNSLREWKL